MRRDARPSRRRLLQLVHSLDVGGAEILAERFARELGGPARVVFACLDRPGTQADRIRGDGFTVEAFSRRPGFDWKCVRALRGLVQRERIDLVHAHQYTPFFYASAARGADRKPLILFTEHGRFFPDSPSRKRKLLNPWLLGRRDQVVAVGECVKNALARNDGFPLSRIEIVLNGVDLTRVQTKSDREQTRSELAIPADAFVVLQVARLDPIKDHETALTAMRHVCDEAPNAHLLVAGDGPQRPTLETAVQRLGLSANVRLLGMRRDVRRLLGAADVVLLTSVSEGIPLTIIEAMAARLPVVATNVGGVREVVVDGETGLLASAGDARAIATALLTMARDADLRNRCGKAGAERAIAYFDERTMLRRYQTLCDEMSA